MTPQENALGEVAFELRAAADRYAAAAVRNASLGTFIDEAFALLGEGRCLLGLSRPTEAAAVLQHAGEIFERLRPPPRSRRATRC